MKRRKNKKRKSIEQLVQRDIIDPSLPLLERCAIIRQQELNGKNGGGGLIEDRSIRKLHRVQRQRLAIELRMSGKSYVEIGNLLGISNCQAHKDVDFVYKEEKEKTKETAKKAKAIELKRLDKLLEVLWPRVTEGVPIIYKGKHRQDAKGKPLYKVDQKALDRVLKIIEKRSKLLGLDEAGKMIFGEDEENPFNKDAQLKLEETIKRMALQK